MKIHDSENEMLSPGGQGENDLWFACLMSLISELYGSHFFFKVYNSGILK